MFHSFRDDARRRFTVTVTGEITLSDAAGFIEAQWAQNAWEYEVLYDLRDASVRMTADDRQRLAQFTEELNHPLTRGPLAVVATDEAVRAFVRAYAERVATGGVRVEIFSEIADAERWLDALGGPPVSLGLRD